MRLTADYHTHTSFSHGTGSVEDNVRAAVDIGLEAIGITDHSIAHPFYGLKRRTLSAYTAAIDDAKRRFENDIVVKAGIELNLIGLDGSVDMPAGIEFDTVILGYHKGAVCKNISTAWNFFTGKDTERITLAYMKAIQANKIDIISHPGYGVPVDYARLAQACSDYGTLFEINNKHADLKAEDIAHLDTKFVVSSDAHCAGNVGRADNALKLVKAAGINTDKIVNVEV